MAPQNKRMKLTSLSAAPGQMEAPPRAPAGTRDGRTGSQLIRGVRLTKGGGDGSVPTLNERESLFQELETMPSFLARYFGSLAGDAVRQRGPEDTFSPVEQSWHLADLEMEGYGVRIRRLLTEQMPSLPDFDGGRIAEERQYQLKSLQEGLRAFESARRANLAQLRSVPESEWARGGIQAGIGAITLAAVPRMMQEHDASHRAEILAWVRAQ